jgi:hypothetical protein
MSYRQLRIQKKSKKTGHIRRYKNLASFNKECGKRAGGVRPSSMMCSLENVRQLKDGSGMATVKVRPMISHYDDNAGKHREDRRTGTWLLHFASATVMKRHLKGRVVEWDGRANLNGRKKRRR